MKEYGLYDVNDYEQCVYIGTIKDIANYLGYSCSSLRSYLVRKQKGTQELLKHKYEMVEIIEQDIEEINIKKKTNKEIFEELIKIFSEQDQITTLKEELAKFEIFDEFQWILKGKLNEIMEFEEEWKQIPGFDYSISNYGHIRNDKNGKLKSLRYHRWIIQVDIYKEGKRYTIDVSRMEASLFIRKVEENERVSYIDGDRRNNYYQNLKIVSK